MKIGIVTEYYYPTLGGIQEHVHHFARRCPAAGARRPHRHARRQRHAGLPGRRGAGAAAARLDRENGVIRLGRSIPVFSGGSVARVSSGPGLSAQVAELLRSEQFDVVHLHSPLMPTLPLLFLRQSSALTVGTFHSVVGRSSFMAALRGSLQRYADRLDAAIGVSETALVDLKRMFQAPWHVIPNGVDVAAFAAGRRRPELDDGRLNVLHVGRFDPRNGVDRVIRAWVRVRRAGIDARLVLVGDGPLRPAYESLIPADLRARRALHGVRAGSPSGRRTTRRRTSSCAPPWAAPSASSCSRRWRPDARWWPPTRPGFATSCATASRGSWWTWPLTGTAPGWRTATTRLLQDAALRRRCGDAGRAAAARFDWPAVTRQVLDLYVRLGAPATTRDPAKRRFRRRMKSSSMNQPARDRAFLAAAALLAIAAGRPHQPAADQERSFVPVAGVDAVRAAAARDREAGARGGHLHDRRRERRPGRAQPGRRRAVAANPRRWTRAALRIAGITADDGVVRQYTWDNRFLFAPLDDLTAARDALHDARDAREPALRAAGRRPANGGGRRLDWTRCGGASTRRAPTRGHPAAAGLGGRPPAADHRARRLQRRRPRSRRPADGRAAGGPSTRPARESGARGPVRGGRGRRPRAGRAARPGPRDGPGDAADGRGGAGWHAALLPLGRGGAGARLVADGGRPGGLRADTASRSAT